MAKKITVSKSIKLPIRGNLKFISLLSLIVALILGSVSLVSILYQNEIYQDKEYLQAFVPTDVAKLCIGLPILLSSIWLARRGKLIGLLLWPGTLLYVLYSSIIFVFAMPLSWFFLLHLILVMLSFFTMAALITNIDDQAVGQQLIGKVPEKLGGGILAGLGIPFLMLASGVMINAVINQTPLTTTEFALQTADFLITPTWIIGGTLLWRRNALGYVVGTGLLFQASMLMVSLLIIILIKPILTQDPFVLSEFIAVLVFGLTCFIPLALFIRGVLSSQCSTNAKSCWNTVRYLSLHLEIPEENLAVISTRVK